MLAIAILGLIGMIVSIFNNLTNDNSKAFVEPNEFLAAITIIAWWKICQPFAITLLVIVILLIMIDIVIRVKTE
jgi:hypothetical protein